jgi:hypothetical protein
LSREFGLYERYGADEYYIYNPDPPHLELSKFVRREGRLEEVEAMNGHVSPRLGIWFQMDDGRLMILRPDGHSFETCEQLGKQADQERERAGQEGRRAELERQRAARVMREAEDLRRRLREPGEGNA